MEVVYGKKVLTDVGYDLEQLYEHRINQISSYTCLGFPANDKDLADNVI